MGKFDHRKNKGDAAHRYEHRENFVRSPSNEAIMRPRPLEERPMEPDGYGYFRTWSEVCRDAMDARGMSYSHLAEIFNMSSSGAERRVYAANPSLTIIEEMAEALGLHADELLARRRYPRRVPRRDEWGALDRPDGEN